MKMSLWNNMLCVYQHALSYFLPTLKNEAEAAGYEM